MDLDFWNDDELEYVALRARNLADEMIVGWRDCTELSGADLTLTTEAMYRYAKMIEFGHAEAHLGEVYRSAVFLYLDSLVTDMRKPRAAGGSFQLGWADTQIAFRALKSLSEVLQERLAELPPPAAEAA